MLAYRTAYMKANYPAEYMCALLTAESGDAEKISDGVEECRKMKIIVGPPDINKSKSGFEIEPNENSLENMAIRFGFSAIKNVGNAAIDNIINERDQNGIFISLGDFCLRVDSQKVNKRVLESLIKVGAMDSFGSRTALLQSLDRIRLDCDRINGKKNDRQFGLFDSPNKDNSKVTAPPDNLPEVEDMTQSQKLAAEKELIGVYVTENPISRILLPYQTLGLPKIAEILEKGEGSQVKIVAAVSRFREITTKKNNSKMAFATFEDETGKIEIVIFPKTYETCKDCLVENKPLYVEGKINHKDATVAILADIISENPPIKSNKFDFVVQVPIGTSQSQLMELNSLLRKNPNGHRGLIILPNGKNVPLSYGVKYNPDLQNEINRILKIN